MNAKQQELCIENGTDSRGELQDFFTWQARGIGFLPDSLASAGPADAPVQLRGMIQCSPASVLPANAEVFFSAGRSRCRQDLAYVRSYISRHYAERLTVGALAALIRVTPPYLGRTFLRTEGISLRAFIENTRLERAAALLRGTDRPVRDVSGDVGFTDVSYFCLRFKNAYGRTPGNYRRHCRGKAEKK